MNKEYREELRAVNRQIAATQRNSNGLLAHYASQRKKVGKEFERAIANLKKARHSQLRALDKQERITQKSVAKTLAALTQRQAILQGRLAS